MPMGQPQQGGQAPKAGTREGQIKANDLVYKLDPDMSVAVSRTHKTHFFQQQTYNSNQQAICILNSGADYIDTRRSFLKLRVDYECKSDEGFVLDDEVNETNWKGTYTNVRRENLSGIVAYSPEIQRPAVENVNPPGELARMVINGEFGPNGSILNIINEIRVVTRSGDELSRTENVALLANMLLPLHHGENWKKTVGNTMGFGGRVGGKNQVRWNGKQLQHSEADRTFAIPMYLLSPLFAYGRLLPAMLMSGLRVQITWHTPEKAFSNVVCRVPYDVVPHTYRKYIDAIDGKNVPKAWESAGFTSEDSDHLRGTFRSDEDGFRHPNFFIKGETEQLKTGKFTSAADGVFDTEVFSSNTHDARHGPNLTLNTPIAGVYSSALYGVDGDLTVLQYQNEHFHDRNASAVEYMKKFPGTILPTYNSDDVAAFNASGNAGHGEGFGGLDKIAGFNSPWHTFQPTNYITSINAAGAPTVSEIKQRSVGWFSPVPGAKKNPDVPAFFTVAELEFSLCSVQLSDAVQRALNEYSAVNGLEIVYCDYDLTTSTLPKAQGTNELYTEIRKSASRALSAYSRILPVYNTSTTAGRDAISVSDPNASYVVHTRSNSMGLTEYQWQLGSLYFPQQKVHSNMGHVGVDPLAYTYALECVNKFNGKDACMLEFNGDTDTTTSNITRDVVQYRPFNRPTAHPATIQSLGREYMYGKPGTYKGGAQTIAVTLERSSLFNLSGIPINNSRVLAIRGKFHCEDEDVYSTIIEKLAINVYLKYVKLARIFLNNVEVEQ